MTNHIFAAAPILYQYLTTAELKILLELKLKGNYGTLQNI